MVSVLLPRRRGVRRRQRVGFDAKDYQVVSAGDPIGQRAMMKDRISVGTYDAQTMFVYRLCLAGAYEESGIFSSLSETAAEIAHDDQPDYQDAHRRTMWDSSFGRNCVGMWGIGSWDELPSQRVAHQAKTRLEWATHGDPSRMNFLVRCCNRTNLVVYCR